MENFHVATGAKKLDSKVQPIIKITLITRSFDNYNYQ